MITQGESVTLRDIWRFQSPTRLVPADGAPERAKLLPEEIAGPLRRLADGNGTTPAATGLAPAVLRALELDGVVRVTPAPPPPAQWIAAAGDDSAEIAALTWGAAFTRLTAEELTRRLYFFGRLPVTADWIRRLPDEDAVARWLGVAEAEQALHGFHPLRRTRETWVWRRWTRPAARGAAGKLYVCCAPADLPGVLRASLPVLRHRAVTGFKLGYDLPTLLRPDKFVLFLDDRGQADELAERVADAVGPCPVHPLPFAAVTAAGDLVRTATDPADTPGRPATRERASWRLNICRLAAETLVANRGRPRIERVAAALERLTLAGIDTRCWAWREAA
ncbi:hypothetical protein ACFQFC_10820 [Amorphoplanes digitatis]|uniref:Uncharacterized protein n=1 Tax=Actinoplanes digitatis TaxID=1868 RepID=A0A7W7MSH8_9ACTN|nr:hypothetical protein [Actinoplanes digitatis]MBB4764690.1 hypothetical protein [Actinoplanes digitatis]GID91358.1 hypothetical protein Adi01nite_07700 [Actinoplanes digitatis]